MPQLPAVDNSWCEQPCCGSKLSYTPGGRVIKHLHSRCWLCQRDVVSNGRYYFCTSCQAGGGPEVVSMFNPDYDPEVAAALPSPA